MASTAKQASEFYNKYRTANALGEGNFSVVKQCYAKSSPSKKYAVKIIKLKGNKAKKEEVARMMFNEVGVMRKLDHGNIIKCIDAFFGIEEILVVLEYTERGDLYDFVINNKEISEPGAKAVMLDIARAVQYLHSKNIVHRDIKPENFLIFPPLKEEKQIVKLCDFGLAVDARQYLTEVCGSPSYVAPEILRMDNYGLPVDVWSCGVVLYILLCQFPPFFGENTRKLFSKILKGEFTFPSPYWDATSENAKDLISRMLVLSTEDRCTANDVTTHAWFEESKTVQPAAPSKKISTSRAQPMNLRGVAIAVRCMQRFAEPLKKPDRERAILSASFVESCELGQTSEEK